MSVKRYTLRSIYKALSSGQDLEMPDCDVIAETDYDALDAQFAELRQHLGTLTPGGSHTCITCAAHVKVITEDLEPRIRALEAELAVEKMQHSVTIADEHESRSAFQHSIRALEAAVTVELALRQTAEAYAARNALRVIELEAALQLIGNELSLQADKGPAGEAFRALLNPTLPETKSAPGFCPECLMTGGHKLRCSKAETPDYGCTGCRSTPCICATLETKGEQGG